jgi:putative DNA primase/helicase
MITTDRIERARAVPIEDLVDRYGLKLRGRTAERVGPCPRCGGEDRFSISTKKRVFNCRGCNARGDVIALVQFLENRTFAEAVDVLAGEPIRRASPSSDNYERSQVDKAHAMYRASVPASGTLAEVYLRARGITLLSPAIRFLAPRGPGRHPAMLVPFGLPDEIEPGVIEIAVGQITAVQVTLLSPEGTKADVKPNKMTIASPAGMPMVVAPMGDPLGLAITEGVEDALSIHQATGLGAWASGGAAFMPKLIAAIDDLAGREYDASPECVTVFAHEDEAGQRGAHDLADALAARDIEVLLEGLTS